MSSNEKRFDSPSVTVCIPVLNAENELGNSILRLDAFLKTTSFKSYKIQIADNGSTDRTATIGRQLAHEIPNVIYSRTEQRGRGRALRGCWQSANTSIVSYMDVDLSTDLCSFSPLISALTEGGADIAVGSRRAHGASVRRNFGRRFITHVFNSMLRHGFCLDLSDTQCGFKALKTSAAKTVLPLIRNNNWFFDTELLLVAKRLPLTIAEVPVVWSDGQNPSTVNIPKTSLEMASGLLRMKFVPLRSLSQNEKPNS